ncbi:FkbM family methyltransferase [Brevundimonas staleyi]|uniref:FkbM family methyltransferase n=1 Tax=Brevundimonas staleyi TaxID=74326 RepID=A0ABW0FQH9_9CAUL
MSAEMLRSRLLASDEIARGLELVGAFQADPQPEPQLDWEDGLRWTYRLALRREASDDDVAMHAPHVSRMADLRRVFTSREFESVSADALILADLDVARQFAPFASAPVGADSFRNFVGAETRLSFLDPSLAWKAGQVEGITRPSQPGLHGLAEWIGSLRSVLDAKDRLVVMELGAGWAPWLVSCALAAKRRGIDDLTLIGVEGSAEHHGFMRQHFLDNGLNPDAYELHHAVVGAEDGVAYFPKLADPTLDYGAFAAFEDGEQGAAAERGMLEEVRCLSLAGLLEKAGRVDLMHMDIQGHEQAVLEASMDRVDRHVHRAIIGTHSRNIDGALLDLFSSHGWHLEYENPAKVLQRPDGGLHFVVDGEQVWLNPKV